MKGQVTNRKKGEGEMISQGYTPRCAGLSLHHSVRVCLRAHVCIAHDYVSGQCNILHMHIRRLTVLHLHWSTTWTKGTQFSVKCHLDQHWLFSDRSKSSRTGRQNCCAVLYYSISSYLSIISEPQQYSRAEVNNHSASQL